MSTVIVAAASMAIIAFCVAYLASDYSERMVRIRQS